MAELIFAAALVIMLAVFAPEFIKRGIRPLVITALLTAASVAGSVALHFIPGLQPSSFIVMLCGISFGPGGGLVCGVLTALIARMFTGLGPWVFWQAFLFGAVGVTAGLIRKASIPVHAAVGFVWGYVFSWVMNLWWYTVAGVPFTWGTFFLACVSSFQFDTLHAAANAALMLTMGKRLRDLIAGAGK